MGQVVPLSFWERLHTGGSKFFQPVFAVGSKDLVELPGAIDDFPWLEDDLVFEG
jgi:hypothetical protein